MTEELPTVLLAEDDPVSRAFLAEALSGLARVDAVACCASAWRCALARSYALLLFDLHLPVRGDGETAPGPLPPFDGSGAQLLRAVRDDVRAASRSSPAVALSAEVDATVRREVLAAGFVAVLAKPLHVAALRELVDELLHDRRGAAWNDADAARSLGNAAFVDSLRQLLRRDLPGQRDRVLAALREGRDADARGELHRLLAAAGLCGASALSAATQRLVDAIDTGASDALARVRFERACRDVLDG